MPKDIDSIFSNPSTKPKLDPSYYGLKAEEREFFQRLTGIEDEEELKAHIVSVQTKAYEILGYPCIRSFGFTRLKIARIPWYKTALQLLKERESSTFLDIGCCFGNDVRRAVLDGWPVENVIASDLRQGFWDYGHELFKSTPETFPAAFIAGDVFDPAMLDPRGPFITPEEIAAIASSPTTPLHSLHSLTPLQGKLSAIHASAFFHLFDEDGQRTLAFRLSSLMSPESGSVIFGQQVSRLQKGLRTEAIHKVGDGGESKTAVMFCHVPDSWKQLWIDEVFDGGDGRGKERVKVDAELVEVVRKDILDALNIPASTQMWVMNWCVTRL